MRRSIFLALLAAASFAVLALFPLAGRLEASIFVNGNTPLNGVQNFGGMLADNFVVGSNDLTVTSAGVFDSSIDPLASTLTWYLYQTTSETLLAKVTFSAGVTYTSTNGSGNPYVWQTLGTPLVLQAGVEYTIAASGYSSNQLASNTYGGYSQVSYSQDGYTVPASPGEAEFGDTPGVFPTLTPANSGFSGDWQFGDANMEYGTETLLSSSDDPQADPEPATLVIWGVLGAAGAAAVRRHRQPKGRWSAESRQAILQVIERNG
jgi:hypothetical protein